MKKPPTAKSLLTSIGITALVGIMFLALVQTSKVSVTEENLTISGIYGINVALTDIVSLAYYDKALTMSTTRINGMGLGRYKIGIFRLPDEGRARLMVKDRGRPYLLITSASEKILIGLGSERNAQLMELLQDRLRR